MIELPILFHNDTTSTFEDIGIEYDLENCDVRDVLFISINLIAPYEDKYTKVYSNADAFICTIDYNELKKKIYGK